MFVLGAEHQNKKCLMGLPERTLMSCGTYKCTLHIQNNILFTKACLSRCCYICYSMRPVHSSMLCLLWVPDLLTGYLDVKALSTDTGPDKRCNLNGKVSDPNVSSKPENFRWVQSPLAKYAPIPFSSSDTLQGCKLQCGSCQTLLKH